MSSMDNIIYDASVCMCVHLCVCVCVCTCIDYTPYLWYHVMVHVSINVIYNHNTMVKDLGSKIRPCFITAMQSRAHLSIL